MSAKTGKNVTRNWFENWSNEYDRTLGRIKYHRDLLDLAVKCSKVKKNYKVLDIGCGTGLSSLKFLKAADCFVTAVDNSKEMMAIFEDKIDKLKLKNRVVCKFMDAGSIKFSNSIFDIAVSTLAIHHLKEKLNPLKKIYKVLKPGGRFIIGEIDMDTTGRLNDVKRFKRIIKVLEQEWIGAFEVEDMNVFIRMFDNSKRHILNDGDYCVSLEQWGKICRRAGFSKVVIKKVPSHKCFGVVIAEKRAI
jgi:ubiquinone/menaquinone biosynthesis C-methylase UbiE